MMFDSHEQKQHQKWMSKAFCEAKKSLNKVYPNPRVGAVIVKDGVLISKAYHKECGREHAEVLAIQKSKGKCFRADLYVTLEPCSSYGLTPPCTDLIIQKKVRRVFIGAYDSNPKNRHKALEVLKEHGVEVYHLDFQKEHDEMNRIFNHLMVSSYPYVQLKFAISMDGCIVDHNGQSKWITSKEARDHSHTLRALSDAVMIGARTFNFDDPLLNIRNSKLKQAKDPAKIIISQSGDLKWDNQLFQNQTNSKVHVLTSKKIDQTDLNKIHNPHVEFKKFSSQKKRINIKRCLTFLRKSGYHNILVEGGRELSSQFVKQHLFNEIHLYVSPKVFGSGGKKMLNETIQFNVDQKFLKLDKIEKIGNDVYLRYVKCLQE